MAAAGGGSGIIMYYIMYYHYSLFVVAVAVVAAVAVLSVVPWIFSQGTVAKQLRVPHKTNGSYCVSSNSD